MKRLSMILDDQRATLLAEHAERESRTSTEIVKRALDAYFAWADRKVKPATPDKRNDSEEANHG